MRFLLCTVLIALACVVGGGLVAAQVQGGDASKMLAATRQALGGEDKLSAVKSFVATGRTRQVRGNNLVPIEFEIACELPDKYVRRDEIPAQESGITSSGFNGESLIQLPPPVEPPPTAKPAVVPTVAPAAPPAAPPVVAAGTEPPAAKPAPPPPDP